MTFTCVALNINDTQRKTIQHNDTQPNDSINNTSQSVTEHKNTVC
jgi:hypothetical protein